MIFFSRSPLHRVRLRLGRIGDLDDRYLPAGRLALRETACSAPAARRTFARPELLQAGPSVGLSFVSAFEHVPKVWLPDGGAAAAFPGFRARLRMVTTRRARRSSSS